MVSLNIAKNQKLNEPWKHVKMSSGCWDKCQANLILTILIFAKFRSPFSVKLGVPSSIKVRSERYIPRYGILGGSHLESMILLMNFISNRIPMQSITKISMSSIAVCDSMKFLNSALALKVFFNCIRFSLKDVLTVLPILSQDFLNRYTDEMVKAAHTLKTQLLRNNTPEAQADL